MTTAAGGCPIVSVVMPVRNAASTVRRAIESIQAQTFAAWELIVVDDGSTDETHALLAEAARGDRRIRILKRQAEGIAAALNAGLATARGELIARMDGDDASHADRLTEQVDFLGAPANRDIGLVSCLVEFGGTPETAEGYALHVAWTNTLITAADIRLNRFIESPFAHPSVMFRREIVARFGNYRSGDFPEDYELWLRWLDAGVRMAKVPRALLTWHDSPGRVSRTDIRYAPEAFYRVKAEWIGKELVLDRGRSREADSGRAVESKPVLVWGAGRHTRKRAEHLTRHGVHIAGYIDVDLKKISAALGGRGVPVISFTKLPPAGEVFVLSYVSTRGAREFIRRELRTRDYVEGRDFLICA